MNLRHRTLVMFAFLALAGACLADAQADSLVAKATAYARALFAGDDLDSYHNADMKAAMTPDAADQARTTIHEAQGELLSVEEAWMEDVLQGYRRYRVPLSFENGRVDLRVAFDTEDLVAGVFFVAPRTRPDTTPVEVPVTERDVLVGSADDGLPGTLSLPEGDGPFPGVVLVHGSGNQDRDETVGPNKPFRDLAWGLAQRGIAVLRYDKRGYARLQSLVAKGYDLTVAHEAVDDAVLAMALLREQPEIDPDRVYLLGHSQGGTVSPRIAKSDGRTAGVVILAGATGPLPEKIAEQIRYIAGLDGEITDEERQTFATTDSVIAALRADIDGGASEGGVYFGAPIGYWRDMESQDHPRMLRDLDLPCLVMQGGRDYQVTGDDLTRWQDALRGSRRACIQVYPAMDHLFRPGTGPSGPTDYDRAEPLDGVVIGDIADWILAGTCPGK